MSKAIYEIVRGTTNNVLVCANSNTACDEITKRLLNVLHKGEMLRIYAKSYDVNDLSEDIRPICNVKMGKFEFPSLDYVYEHRVVICTLTTAGCMTRARNRVRNFSSDHFGYIFLDEAAAVQETVSLIAIAGMHIFLFLIFILISLERVDDSFGKLMNFITFYFKEDENMNEIFCV